MLDKTLVLVGVIHGAHGVRGLLKVESLSDNPARFAPGSQVYAEQRPEAGRQRPAGLAPKSMILSDSQVHSSGFAAGKSLLGEADRGTINRARTLVVRSATPHKGKLLLDFEGIESREDAAALFGMQLMAEPDAAPLPEGQYYHYQLAGLAVYERGEYIGKITDILTRPANDIYVMQSEAGEEIWIPALKTVVKNIDLVSQRMEVELPIND
jgi:16S rRNA processing protein RimM